MLLMIKDTATARFHSLLSMETSHKNDYDDLDYNLQEMTYKLGDKVLYDNGSKACKGFSMDRAHYKL